MHIQIKSVMEHEGEKEREGQRSNLGSLLC